MAGAFLNDLDTDMGGMEGAVQYPTKSQLVRNIAGDPTNAQLLGLYNREGIDHLPSITMGCDLPTLYTPCSQNWLKSFDADTYPGLEHPTTLPRNVPSYKSEGVHRAMSKARVASLPSPTGVEVEDIDMDTVHTPLPKQNQHGQKRYCAWEKPKVQSKWPKLDKTPGKDMAM